MSHALTLEHLLHLVQPTVRVPLHLSPDSRWLALSTQPVGGRGQATGINYFTADGVSGEMIGSRVLIVDTMDGAITTPFPERSTSWGPRWSPDGRWLAAYIFHDGPPCLALWSTEQQTVRWCRQALVRPFFGFEVPEWTPDSQAVVLKLAPHEASARPGEPPASTEAAAVTVFSFDPMCATTLPPTPTFAEERGKGDVAWVDVQTQTVHRLAAAWTFQGWRVAPDGHAVAVLKLTDSETTRQQFFYDLMVAPLSGEEPQTVAARVPQNYGIAFSWSPDSRMLAYTTRERGQPGRLFLVPADGSSPPRELTDGIAASFAQDYECPRWSQDGTTLYCLADGAVWTFAADGSGHRMLRPELRSDVRGWLQPFGRPTLWMPDAGAVLLLVRDPATKDEGIARLDLRTGVARLLVEGPQTFAMPAGLLLVEASVDGAACYLLAEAADHPAEVWRSDADTGAMRRLVSLTPGLDGVELGTARLVAWRAADGAVRRGALLLPATYREGERLPLIVAVYGGAMGSDAVHRFGFGGHHVDNAQLLASGGYAVLHLDMPLRDHDPLRQLPELVLPAVDALIEHGIADPDQLGLWGHSYGGYTVLALLTQTTRFRAAVASAPWGINLTSMYGVLSDSGDSFHLGWCESGQARLAGTPWEKRDAYIENSPFFYLDRVQTPLLLVCGTADTGATAQAGEAFSALRRLNQRVELRRYRDEGHWPGAWTEPNVRDLSSRVLDWYAHYLQVDGGATP